MKTETTNQIEVINDLLRINLDRVEGYEKAAGQTRDEDQDLRRIFQAMANQSQDFASELRKFVYRDGGEPENNSTTAGKLYRTWMDLKVVFTGKDRKAILSSCEFGEDAALKAYRTALKDPDTSDPNLRMVLTDQETKLRAAHDQIKQLRDQQN
ncbi:MAG: PA2169 family four-helix-bundle protein [Chitinophagaceae bacterium]|nr:PA2169 family four-helix-bundle protein [Chitinophagaceae bacterium]